MRPLVSTHTFLSGLVQKTKRGLFLIKHKGLRYAYNRWWQRTFLNSVGSLRALLYLKLFPLLGYAPYPSLIVIEMTTRCNLKCTICENTYWNEPAQDISFEQVKSIVDQFPKLKAISVTGIGESFLNKDFMKICRYVKSNWPSIYIELFDNFYFINEEVAKELIDLGIDKIFASIDGATKETYESIRVGSDFERVTGNVKKFIELRNEIGTSFPEFVFHYIITKTNVQEIPHYLKLVKSLGGNTVFFTRMLHTFEEVKELIMEINPQIIKETEELAKKLEVKIIWHKNVPEEKLPICECTYWIMPFIYVTGHVIPCCTMNEANVRSFQKKNAMGNVFEKNFKEIWNSSEFKTFRKMLRKGEVPRLCVDCLIFTSNGKMRG